MTEERKTVYLSLHESYVREGVPYLDEEGRDRTFNVATLPKGTVINGRDMGGWQFSPLYVNPSKYRGESWRDIPLMADREVWLSRPARDAEGNRLVGEGGEFERETTRVSPQEIKDALVESRRAWAEKNAPERSLRDRSQDAREFSQSADRDAGHLTPASR